MSMAEMGDLPDLPRPDEIEEGVLHVFDELDAPEGDEGEGYRIPDDGAADWALRKLTGIRARIANVNAQADRQLEAIEQMILPYMLPIREWRNNQLAQLGDEEQFWVGLVTLYHRNVVLAADPAQKTLKLPHGTVSSRKSPDRWDFDAEAFLAWARDVAPEFVREVQEPDRALAKKTLKANAMGQVVYMHGDDVVPVPSVNVTPGERSFTVKTEGLAQ